MANSDIIRRHYVIRCADIVKRGISARRRRSMRDSIASAGASVSIRRQGSKMWQQQAWHA